MRHGLSALLLIGALLGVPAAGRAQAPPGDGATAQECCLGLLLPVGARSVALGRALAARSSEDAAFGNPAGLSTLDTTQLVVHHAPLPANGQANAISVLWPRSLVGTLGLSWQLLDYGEDVATDVEGNRVGTIFLREHFLVASFATGVMPGLSAGLSYKLYQFRIDCSGFCNGVDGSATTHGVDLGVQYHPAWAPHLELGAAVTDLGFPLQVINEPQADRQPTRLRAGAAYEVLHHFQPDSALTLWVSAELEEPLLTPVDRVWSIGSELAVGRAVFVRAGYRSGEGVGSGPALGLGVRYQRFTIGIAKAFFGSSLTPDYDPVQISFGVAL